MNVAGKEWHSPLADPEKVRLCVQTSDTVPGEMEANSSVDGHEGEHLTIKRNMKPMVSAEAARE